MSDSKLAYNLKNYVSRPKCAICDYKINHLDIVCKCGKTFCLSHMFPENHDCQFDYKTYERKKMMMKIMNY